jgi:hypothetical protein
MSGCLASTWLQCAAETVAILAHGYQHWREEEQSQCARVTREAVTTQHRPMEWWRSHWRDGEEEMCIGAAMRHNRR